MILCAICLIWVFLKSRQYNIITQTQSNKRWSWSQCTDNRWRRSVILTPEHVDGLDIQKLRLGKTLPRAPEQEDTAAAATVITHTHARPHIYTHDISAQVCLLARRIVHLRNSFFIAFFVVLLVFFLLLQSRSQSARAAPRAVCRSFIASAAVCQKKVAPNHFSWSHENTKICFFLSREKEKYLRERLKVALAVRSFSVHLHGKAPRAQVHVMSGSRCFARSAPCVGCTRNPSTPFLWGFPPWSF